MPIQIPAKYFKYLLLPTAKRRPDFQAIISLQRKRSREATSFPFPGTSRKPHIWTVHFITLPQKTQYTCSSKNVKYRFINIFCDNFQDLWHNLSLPRFHYLLPEREIGSSWSPLQRKLTHDLSCLHWGVKGTSISSFKYGIYSARNCIKPQPKQK